MAKKTIAKNKTIPLNPTGGEVLFLNDATGTQPFRDYAARLNGRFNKDQVQEMASHIRSTFLPFSICDRQQPACGIATFDLVMKEGLNVRKDYLCNFVALIISDDENFATYIAHLRSEEQQLWELLFRRGYVSDQQAFEATGRHWVEVRRRSYWGSATPASLSNAMSFFGFSTYYYNYVEDPQPYIYMGEEMWQRYARAVYRPRCKAQPETVGIGADELPAHLLRYSNEDAIGAQIATLAQMQEQGLLEFGATKMSQTTIKRAVKTIGLTELFPDTRYKDEVLMEASLMVPALTAYFKDNTVQDVTAYWKVLRGCINELDYDLWFMEFFRHLRAVNRNNMGVDCQLLSIYNEILDAITLLPVGRWFSYAELEQRRLLLPDSEQQAVTGIQWRDIIETKITFASGKGRRFRVEDAYTAIGRPVAKGLLVLLATYGLVDIAYHSAIDEGQESCWECVDYVSLTALGAYVLGQTDTYQSDIVIHSPQEYFVVDADRLIIRAIDIDGKNPYENLLSRIATPIGSRRYHVTPEVFMKGVTNEIDLDAKERFFRDTVSTDVPPVWQQFFKDMRQRCFPLRLAGVGYRVLRVVSTDPAFLRILTTDSYIRAHTLRAEKALLLVETRSYEKVLDRIRSYGYLM